MTLRPDPHERDESSPTSGEIASSISSEDPPDSPLGPVARARKAKLRATLFDEPIGVQRFGRYSVLGTLGQGGMGTVLEAFDPILDRRVAVKVLHTDVGERHAQRLIREAQALARLSHPNVVQVYEAGEVAGRAFVAMELVRGQTLAQWAQRRPLATWRECLDLYLQAGKGLVAAHAQGLVHRDFKPTNAIVDDEGRVRVLDFGLARRAQTVDEARDLDPIAELSALDRSLTITGAVLGTPAYMPPEQMRGQEADARSDQFSFCVSLFEAIYGRRPYAGDSLPALLLSMKEDNIPMAPKGIDVPTVLHRVLLRGLEVSPAARWPSMNALLAELQRLVTPPTRRWIGLGLALGLAAIGGGLAWYAEVGARCEGARDELAGIWDEARTQELEAAFSATGLPYATQSWATVQARLEAYANTWVATHTEACEATRVTQSQAEAVMSLRMGCLSRRRVELRAAVGVLAEVDATRLDHAIELVEHLSPLSQCDDIMALNAELLPPSDPRVSADVGHARARLAEAWALRLAGDYPQATRVSDEVVQRSDALDYGPLRAEAMLRRGQARARNDQPDAAAEDLESAYLLAEEYEHPSVEFDAVVELVYAVGHQQRLLDRANHWSSLALALAGRDSIDPQARAAALYSVAVVQLDAREPARALIRLQEALTLFRDSPTPHTTYIANTLRHIGIALEQQDRWDEALEHYRRALEIRQEVSGRRHPAVAHMLIPIASALRHQGRLAEALEHYEHALDIFQSTLTTNHSQLASVESDIGTVLDMQGQSEQALVHHRRALAIREARMGPRHPDLAITLINLANAHFGRGEHQEALDHYLRALDIQHQALGPEHPDLAGLHSNIGLVLTALDRADEALTHHEQALAIAEKTLGPEHSTVSLMLDNLGETHLALGTLAEARAAYQRALAIAEAVAGPEHPLVAYPLVGLAEVALREDDRARARPHAERALAIRESSEGMPTELAQARFLLAQALWPEVAQRPRARSLAQQARQIYTEHPAGSEPMLAQVDAWLAAHE